MALAHLTSVFKVSSFNELNVSSFFNNVSSFTCLECVYKLDCDLEALCLPAGVITNHRCVFIRGLQCKSVQLCSVCLQVQSKLQNRRRAPCVCIKCVTDSDVSSFNLLMCLHSWHGISTCMYTHSWHGISTCMYIYVSTLVLYGGRYPWICIHIGHTYLDI